MHVRVSDPYTGQDGAWPISEGGSDAAGISVELRERSITSRHRHRNDVGNLLRPEGDIAIEHGIRPQDEKACSTIHAVLASYTGPDCEVTAPAWTTYASEARRMIAAVRVDGACTVMPTDRFIADKAKLRAELERRARERRTITYGEAAALLGRASQGLGKILTAIRAEETGWRRPDLGCLVVKVRTGLPSYVGPGQDARKKAIAVQEAVFAAWGSPQS